jgi:hypothetical protein
MFGIGMARCRSPNASSLPSRLVWRVRPPPELDAIVQLAQRAPADTLAIVDELPIHCFRFGTRDLRSPALLVVGGVHGVERIGTHVAIAYLSSVIARLDWDELLRQALERVRLIIVPLLNPVGMALGQRANGQGVDLMRNAPDPAKIATPLVGGQRISARLPWFMGSGVQPESAALMSLVQRELFEAPASIALDLHSGFGLVDRLWYPYARTREAPPDQPAIDALHGLLDRSLPNHVYQIEQTARVYTIRGDLWDYLYDRRRQRGPGIMLPLTLEMGSWSWVRKNPVQGFSVEGRFNPIKPHRLRRTLRRHIPLIELLLHAAASPRAWSLDVE